MITLQHNKMSYGLNLNRKKYISSCISLLSYRYWIRSLYLITPYYEWNH